MRSLRAPLFVAAALAACSLTACKGGEAEKPAETKPAVQWPAAPTDGSNVVIVFKKLVGEGKDREGLFDVFNFSEDENISELRMTLEYRDKDGKVIKTFPFTQMKAFYSKEVGEMKAGFFLPEETVSVTAQVHYVKFNTKEWGSKTGTPKVELAPATEAAPASEAAPATDAAPASEAAPASAP